jgi:hypothetical protein
MSCIPYGDKGDSEDPWPWPKGLFCHLFLMFFPKRNFSLRECSELDSELTEALSGVSGEKGSAIGVVGVAAAASAYDFVGDSGRLLVLALVLVLFTPGSIRSVRVGLFLDMILSCEFFDNSGGVSFVSRSERSERAALFPDDSCPYDFFGNSGGVSFVPCSVLSERTVSSSGEAFSVVRPQACASLFVIGVVKSRRTTPGRVIARPILTCLLVDSQWLKTTIREVAISMTG